MLSSPGVCCVLYTDDSKLFIFCQLTVSNNWLIITDVRAFITLWMVVLHLPTDLVRRCVRFNDGHLLNACFLLKNIKRLTLYCTYVYLTLLIVVLLLQIFHWSTYIKESKQVVTSCFIFVCVRNYDTIFFCSSTYDGSRFQCKNNNLGRTDVHEYQTRKQVEGEP